MTRKIIDYKILITSATLSDRGLSQAVHASMRKGWQPLGACQVVVREHNGIRFLQTMVKYETDQPIIK